MSADSKVAALGGCNPSQCAVMQSSVTIAAAHTEQLPVSHDLGDHGIRG